MPRDIIDSPIHNRAGGVAPSVRIVDFDFDDEEWPHPGPSDKGPIFALFAEMDQWWPPDLRDGERFQTPSAGQMNEIDRRSETEVLVAIENYLKGVPPDRKWSDVKMAKIFDAYLDRSIDVAERVYIVEYALKEHQI